MQVEPLCNKYLRKRINHKARKNLKSNFNAE